MNTKNFLIYLTANDDPHFVIDYLNFKKMAYMQPGVEKIYFVLVISCVRQITEKDLLIVNELQKILINNNKIVSLRIIFKGNIGRDFSSAEAGINEIDNFANDHDYIMIKNRSGYGPLKNNWYKQYVDQLNKNPLIGMVGSTINLVGHPKINTDDSNVHVQTYVYMTKWGIISPLKGSYPGSKTIDRLDLIDQGEIGLSKYFLSRGYGISSLYWDGSIFFNNCSKNSEELPLRDIKGEAYDVPIRYKYKEYKKGVFTKLTIVKYFIKINFKCMLAYLGLLKLVFIKDYKINKNYGKWVD